MRGHPLRPVTGVLCALGVCLAAASPSPALEAGAAKVDLALEPGIPLDGDFLRRGRGATSVHDPLYVRALYLDEGGVKCFLVVADLFAITPDLRARVLEIAPAEVDPGNIILVATHTRSGPGGLDRSWLARQRGGRFMPELVESTALKFAKAMRDAYDGRRRGAIGYASGTVALGADRFAPQQTVEGRMTVLRVDDSDGNAVAIVANFSAGAENASLVDAFAFSADYPGVFCEALEATAAGGTVAFFLNGESADRSMTAPGSRVDWAAIRTFGAALASRARALANEITCRELPVRFVSRSDNVPIHAASTFFPVSATTQVLEVDRLAMVFLPIVPYGSTGSTLRSAALGAGYTHVMTVAPANGYVGAAAPPDGYTRVSDEADPVYLDPGAAALFAERAAALLPRAESPAESPVHATEPVPVRVNAGLAWFLESGTPAEAGRARGESMRALLPEGLGEAVSFDWLRGTPSSGLLGHWQLLRGVANEQSLAIALASNDARRLLAALPSPSTERLTAASASAGIALQRLWLMQLAPAESAGDELISGVGVLFSAASESDGLLIGQTLRWPGTAPAAVTQATPRQGHAYAIAGMPWHMSGACGINERGIVLAAAPSARSTESAISAPAEVLFDETLRRAGTLDEALAILTIPRDGFRGRILVGSVERGLTQPVIVEVGPVPVVLDMAPTDIIHRDAIAPQADEARVARLLRGLSAPTAADFERIVSDRDRRAQEGGRVLTPHTRACVVLVPASREMRIMAPLDGEPREFERVRVGGEGS